MTAAPTPTPIPTLAPSVRPELREENDVWVDDERAAVPEYGGCVADGAGGIEKIVVFSSDMLVIIVIVREEEAPFEEEGIISWRVMVPVGSEDSEVFRGLVLEDAEPGTVGAGAALASNPPAANRIVLGLAIDVGVCELKM